MVADGNSTLTLEVNGVLTDTWSETQLADGQLIVLEYQLADGGETDDPPVNDTGAPVNDTDDPPTNNTSEELDDSGLPAPSLLTAALAVAIIALKRRRSD